jgi:hypothetical protein
LNGRTLSKTQNRNQNKREKESRRKKIKEEARSPTGLTPGDQPAQPAPS